MSAGLITPETYVPFVIVMKIKPAGSYAAVVMGHGRWNLDQGLIFCVTLALTLS